MIIGIERSAREPHFRRYKAQQQYRAWIDEVVASDIEESRLMQRYTIELRFDDEDDPQKKKAIASVLKQQARTLFTSALMIAGRRKPTIAIHSNDHFMKQELVLNEDNNGEL